MSTNPTITLDQQLAVKTSASRLAEEFSATFNAETIERFLHSSFDEFAGKATIDKFLPLLAERFARQRLQALSRIEGHVSDGKPVVLFMCVHNAGRSQMALGFFTSYAADNAIAWSGGSEPGAEISEVAVAAMAEKGVDIPASSPSRGPTRSSKPPTSSSPWAVARRAPSSPARSTRNGCSRTQPGRTSRRCDAIRDEVEQRVLHLLEELGVPQPAPR
jgi:arsenate reductase